MQNVTGNYWSIWKQFVLHGVMSEDSLPPPIMQSWRRSAAQGLDPYAMNISEAEGCPAAPHNTTEPPRTLVPLIRPAMEDLHQFVEGSQCVIVFANAQTTIVDIVGDHLLQEELEHLGLRPGVSWSEEVRGTNALALALQESFPIQLDGPMHYCAALHPLYTSAAPVHDLIGQPVGVLGVIGRYEHRHPHTLGMITAAAQDMSNRLQIQIWLNNANHLLSELNMILQSLSEGILLLHHDGTISQMNASAGMMLGLTPERVTGRVLSDVLPIPDMLTHALATRQSLSYEELVFETVRGRIPYLCTLKSLSSYQLETTLEMITPSPGLMVTESVSGDSFILILRSIERVQKLVHRMTGPHARLTFQHVVGKSPALEEALRRARLAANSNATVLLHGETGTGKEIFAQSIHNASARADGPFIAVNCAAIPRELITTELFGYEGGSFTGADRQGRSGKFEMAHKGTLFLDEIGDMPLDLQTSLLRAIETHTIVRVGGHRVINTDVRIVAATHKDLHTEAMRGNFRSDLYYRLNVLTIEIPSLRERIDDIPLLVQHFLQRQVEVLGRPLTISSGALEALTRYNWPGNVRELENMLERVTHLTSKTTITVDDLPITQKEQPAESSPAHRYTPHPLELPTPLTKNKPATEKASLLSLRQKSIHAEAEAILQAWQQSNGNVTHAAAQLGISRTTMWRKMVKYGISGRPSSENGVSR
jgi:transcriptional regulator of acetoin/glycerol metabolism